MRPGAAAGAVVPSGDGTGGGGANQEGRMRVAVDVGGTFTDAVAFDRRTRSILMGKVPTRTGDLVGGVLEAMRRLRLEAPAVDQLVHGSTLAINAIVERRGARTALLTTRGFRDVYEIGRINRPDSFNLFFRKHRPLIPRDLVFEVDERMLADGTEERPLDEAEIEGIARELERRGVESAAVVFLHSYRWPEHERRAAAALRRVLPGLYVIASHQLSREYREFERTSTTAASAYVGPLISGYLGDLERRLRDQGMRGEILLMQSSGGMSDLASARVRCLQMLESGPAGGAVGTGVVGEELGLDNLIAFDMGGTTAKACVVRRGRPSLAGDYFIGGYEEGLAVRIPILDIVEIGTGGGSVGWIDEGGGLHVGPRSAGAEPGPACYGRGGSEATVTDASVFLGEIGAEPLPGSELVLDASAAEHAIRARLAGPLGLDPVRAAWGLLEIATSSMANAVRSVTTQRGLDPRDFTLVAYGGGGPVRAVAVARELHVPRVVIPRAPATFAALGMLLADRRHDYVQTVFARLDGVAMEELEAAFRALESEAREELVAGGAGPVEVHYERAADMRYLGQEHAVTVAVPPGRLDEHARARLKAAFDTAHLERYSHHAPEEPAELVSIRLSATVANPRPEFPCLPSGGAAPSAEAVIGTRAVTFSPGTGPVSCLRYWRPALLAGNLITGPALVEEPSTVTVVPPDAHVTVHPSGHLVVDLMAMPGGQG
jgi:N-methylhydantoinase A